MTRTKAERAALDRDGGICRRCGWAVGHLWSLHHRLPRSAGTKEQVDRVDNLILLCGSGTSPGCHQFVHNHPTYSYNTGWLIRRGGFDLLFEIPLTDIRGSVFALTEEATVIRVTGGGLLPDHPEEIESPF